MIINKIGTRCAWIAIVMLLCINGVSAQKEKEKTHAQKKVFIPKNVSRVPENNNFDDNNSTFSNRRKVESANVVIFWSKDYGDDPMKNADSSKRFDVQRALGETERSYNYYVDTLQVLKKGSSVSDKYKALVFIYGGEETTAYGWGKDSVAIVWAPAMRVHKFPYGVLAHELGHSFQYMAGCDRGLSFTGAINEMGSQYLLWQVYPNWLDFENFHLKAFLKQTNLAFLHPENQYHSPFILEYWAEKHGKQFYGKLLSGLNKGEDPVMTYKRLNNITQRDFNDEVFDAARKFITWDLDRVRNIAAKYANQHKTQFTIAENGWYSITRKDCPQDYGYNAIRLKIPSVSKIRLDFIGMADTSSYPNSHIQDAGWRYGFLAVKKNGKRVYGKVCGFSKGTLAFNVPKETAFLWLVVSGAPIEHSKLRGKKTFNQWPYKIRLSKTDLFEEDKVPQS